MVGVEDSLEVLSLGFSRSPLSLSLVEGFAVPAVGWLCVLFLVCGLVGLYDGLVNTIHLCVSSVMCEIYFMLNPPSHHGGCCCRGVWGFSVSGCATLLCGLGRGERISFLPLVYVQRVRRCRVFVVLWWGCSFQ